MAKNKKQSSSTAAENSAAAENSVAAENSAAEESSAAAENTAAEEQTEASADKDTAKKKSKKEISPELADEKAKKKAYNRRKLKYGSVATAITVVVIAAVVLVNVIVDLASDRVNMSLDLTPGGTFEISQETKDYLDTVNEPVEIVCLSDELTFQTSNYIYFKQAYEVLKKYSIYSDNVTVKYVDMTKDPTYVNRYSEMYSGEISQYSIVVESSKRIKVMSIQDLYNVEMNYNTFSQEIVSSKAEQELTSAIMYVTDPNPIKAVVFNSETSGSSYDNVIDLLTSNGFDVSEIDPLVDMIPEDAQLLVINAPLNDYDNDIIDMVYKFLDNGGQLGRNLIYIADYSQKTTANIDALLAEWGIKVETGVVGDQNTKNLMGQSYYNIKNYITENDYSSNVSEMSLPVLDYQSRPITLLFDTKDTRTATALLRTSETGFIMTEEMQDAIRNGESPQIETSPQTTMAIGSKYIFNSDNEAVYSNVLVIGSSETLDKSFTETTYYNNGDYFMSILNTMTGKNTGITIVAKDLTSVTFDADMAVVSRYYILFVAVIPLAVLAVGVVVYFKRRTK